MMIKYRTRGFARSLTSGVALAVMTFASAAAHAQEAPAGDTRSSDTTTDGQLGEIVVTAQKRSENLQKTPIAITALSSDRIDQGGIDEPQKLQFIVPSLTFGTVGPFTRLTLRGIGSDASGLSEASVATYNDGVYTGMQIGQQMPTFDLERIEVLRGPQGTLYGRNTTGGVINYITKKPSFDFGGAAEISYGNYNAISAKFGVTGPIVEDKIAARFSFQYNNHDGYYRNIALGEREYAQRDIGGRLSVLFTPTENLSITVRGDKSHQTSSDAYVLVDATSLDGGLTDTMHPLGVFSQPASFFTANPGLLSPSDIAKLNGGSIASYYGLIQPTITPPNPLKTGTYANAMPTDYTTDASGASITFDWDVGAVAIKSITGYRHARIEASADTSGFSFPNVYQTPTVQSENQYTQEFNISGKAFDDKLDFLAGAYFYRDDGVQGITAFLPALGQSLEAAASLANPPGSPYAFNLDAAALTPLNNLPGVLPSPFNTAVRTGPNYPGDAAGPVLIAGSTIPSTAYVTSLQNLQSTSYAGFLQGTYRVTDSLRLTGGIRYTIDTKETHRVIHNNFAWALLSNAIFQGVQAGYLPPETYNPDVIAAAAGVCDTRSKKTWRATTGLVNVDYDVARNVLVYGKASWGYKAGGFNASECTASYDPEYLTDYEGGVKALLADGQVLANLAVFHYDYRDIQFITYSGTNAVLLNAGSAKVLGVEFEYALRPRFLSGWQLDGSVSYTDSRYGKGCFADPANTNNAGFLSTPKQACPATVINPNTGLPVPIGASANIEGNDLIRAPRWKANVGMQYAAEISDFGNILARVDAAWTDRIHNDILNGKALGLGEATQPSYWMLNAVLSWTSSDKRLSVDLFGDNLTKTRYLNSRIATNVPTTISTVSGLLGAPRTYGIRVKAKFGPGNF